MTLSKKAVFPKEEIEIRELDVDSCLDQFHKGLVYIDRLGIYRYLSLIYLPVKLRADNFSLSSYLLYSISVIYYFYLN